MALHKEFETAGKVSGLQVWRLEKMDLAPVPPELYGDFFTGDAYLVLHTTSAPSYDIHIWIGDEASQDERAAAAIFMTQLDDHLKGAPIQYRECQWYESDTFLGYFKPSIKYKKGGVASGFSHVVTNDFTVKRLLHVKGRRKVRAMEVELAWSSFNKGDCFIIDLGEKIYDWRGSECNYFESLQATKVARDIRDSERSGRAEVEIIEEGSEPADVIAELGTKPDLPPGGCDKHADKENKNKATLYLISDATGSMDVTVVGKRPLKQDMLSSKECYILDNAGDNHVFVWKGKDANEAERKKAITHAEQFIEDKNYPKYIQVQTMSDGGENTLFKQFFFNWLERHTTGKTCTVGSVAQVEQVPFDATKLHNKMAAHHNMPDDGSGKVEIWRVEDKDKVPVDELTYGQFFGGDCYLILYTYNVDGREKHIIYTWQGLTCSQIELGASAILTVELDDSMGGVATQTRVTQGQEPPHFVSVFKGKPVVIHRGGTCRHSYEPPSTRLFHIRMSSTKATRAVEVEPTASALNSNDLFVLKAPEALTLWKGKGACPEEMDAAKHVASLLGGTVTEVDEGQEPDGFWKALGGKKEYQTSEVLRDMVRPPRLFACSNKTGTVIVEEVFGEFTQMDLASDDVMILDVWEQIYVWVGKDANEAEKSGAYPIAKEYLESHPAGRCCGTTITTLKQGEETPCFTGWFQAWDPKMWDKDLLECMLQSCKD